MRKEEKVERGKRSYKISYGTKIFLSFDSDVLNRQFGKLQARNRGQLFGAEIRSPQAIMYFVGELIRRQVYDKKAPIGILSGTPKKGADERYYRDKAPLVVVRRGRSTNASVDVAFRGQRFYVPEPFAQGVDHRTLQVFALINQLIVEATGKDTVPQPSTIVIRN